jgi:hypothetical protein
VKSPRDGFADHLNLIIAQKRIATLLGGDAWVHSLGKMSGTELTWPVFKLDDLIAALAPCCASYATQHRFY